MQIWPDLALAQLKFAQESILLVLCMLFLNPPSVNYYAIYKICHGCDPALVTKIRHVIKSPVFGTPFHFSCFGMPHRPRTDVPKGLQLHI